MTDAVLTLFQWHNLLYLLLGTSVGIVVEGIPGLTSTMLIALTLPLTFQMDPVSAMTLLIGEYVGGISGGLVAAVLLRMPGTPSSIVTTFDGYPMAQQGKAERALALGIFASVVGGLISWAFLAGMSPSLARFALGFGPWEYCTLVLAALFMLAALTQGSLVRGLLGAAVGMALSLPGIAPSIGTPRLTFGSDALLSGTARGHGDRDLQPALPMPKGVPTLADAFSGAGDQTFATGKLHVYPMRDRIGFDDVLSAEEGRSHLGGPDDYEIALADAGHAGAQFLHGMGNNEYSWAPWHLPDALHVTNWTARMAARQIHRRDPTRPGFWYLSFAHPHPPLAPLGSYIARYAGRTVPEPLSAAWQEDAPWLLRSMQNRFAPVTPEQMSDMRRAYYALVTQIDHQLRLVIGSLREEGILDDTIIVFTADHGEMLGDFGVYAKRLMLDGSARVPLLIVDAKSSRRIAADAVSDRLVGLQDIMPTLLDLAGIDCPETVEGRSVLSETPREWVYGECHTGAKATRMVRDRSHKLIWYPAGNRFQLFDMVADPLERTDLSARPEEAPRMAAMQALLRGALYGEDLALVDGDRFVGLPAPALRTPDNRGLSGQHGPHFPQPPATDPSSPVGAG